MDRDIIFHAAKLELNQKFHVMKKNKQTFINKCLTIIFLILAALILNLYLFGAFK